MGFSEAFLLLEREVQQRYPDLRLVDTGGAPVLRGSFPVEHDGHVLDRFTIELSFPAGPAGLPDIRELGGRIPHESDRHVNVATGILCTEVPENWMLRGKTSLVDYLDGPVRNFFLSQLLVEAGQDWPFGHWPHAKPGLLKAYGEWVASDDPLVIEQYLVYLTRSPKGHWDCPCGSGRRLRQCHLDHFKALQARIPRSIAASALKRLRTTK